MTLRLLVLICAVVLPPLVGCREPTPPTARNPMPAGDVPPAAEPAEVQKLALLAQKYSASDVAEVRFAGRTFPGRFIAIEFLASAPDDARLAELAKELKDVKQDVMLGFQFGKQPTAAGLAPLAEVKCVAGIYL